MTIIQDGLNQINTIKQNIHASIENKGVTIPDDTPFSEYPAKIDSIATGGGATADNTKIVRFKIYPESAAGKTIMHVENAINTYMDVSIVNKGQTIRYYASCTGYYDSQPNILTVTTNNYVQITLQPL